MLVLGKCCTGPSGFVWITEADVKAMSTKLGISEKTFYAQYTRYVPQYQRYTLTERPHRPTTATATATQKPPSSTPFQSTATIPSTSEIDSAKEAEISEFPTEIPADEEEFECVFLEGTKCSIYDVRPVQCKTFPYWPSVLQSKRSWASTQNRCEGIDHPDSPLVPPKVISQQMTAYANEVKQWESHKKRKT